MSPFYKGTILLVLGQLHTVSFGVMLWPGVKCVLRKCEWVFCELKHKPARDWSYF